MRRPSATIWFKDISSETTRTRALTFGMEYCLVDLYQVCSNGGHGIQNGLVAGDFGFVNKIYLKFSPELLGSGALNLVFSVRL